MPRFNLNITGEPYGEGAVHQIAAIAAVHGMQFTLLDQNGDPLSADQIRIADYVPLSASLNPLAPERRCMLDRLQHKSFREFWLMIDREHNSMLVVLKLMIGLDLSFADVTPAELLREDLEELNLGDSVWNVLTAADITSVQFLRRWTPAELREIPDMTEPMITQIAAAQDHAGIAYLRA